MKVLILGVGAFGFPIIQHISKNHPNEKFFAYEKNQESLNYMIEKRRNPFFFTDTVLSENIVLVDRLDEIMPTIDLIILAIPNQFIHSSISATKHLLKPGVCFLNLSKGIDSTTLSTVSDTLSKELCDFPYEYAVLSGGMIAQELIEGKILGAQIGITDLALGEKLKVLFENDTLKICLSRDYKNIELYGALKNIIALYTGYLEGKGLGYSTIGYYLCELLKELKILLPLLGGTNISDFSDYSLGGDVIATCFGNSRNRYFGKLVGSGASCSEALEVLKSENKHAEGYETLKGIKSIILDVEGINTLKNIVKIFL